MTPVEAQQFLLASLSAAGIVVFGAGYAVLLALGRLSGLAVLRRVALYVYVGVVASCGALAWFLRLEGAWLALIALLVVGYFIAPRAIWRLSVATHEGVEDDAGETHGRSPGGKAKAAP